MFDILKYMVKLNKKMEREYLLYSKKQKDALNNWIMYGFCSVALVILLMTRLNLYEEILFYAFFIGWTRFLLFRMKEEKP